MSSSWFLVWVPARNWEREQNSKSRYSDEYSRGRSCSFGRNQGDHRCCSGTLRDGSRERSCSGYSSYVEPEDGVVRPPFRFNEDRPVLKSLPAIQEDHDHLGPRPEEPLVDPLIDPLSPLDDQANEEVPPSDESDTQKSNSTPDKDASQLSQTIEAEPPGGGTQTQAKCVTEASSDQAVKCPKKSSYTVTIVPEECPPCVPIAIVPKENTPSVTIIPKENTPSVTIIPKDNTPFVTIIPKENTPSVTIIPKENTPSVTIVPKENTPSVLTTTTTCSETTCNNSPTPSSPDQDPSISGKEDRLLKQESYDSHVRRGAGGQFTPSTPAGDTPGSVESTAALGSLDRGLGYKNNRPASRDDIGVDKTAAFIEFEPMQDIVDKLLENLEINPVSVQTSSNKKQVLFTFCVPFGLVEAVLLEFQNQGIGQHGDSTISVVPASIHYSTHELPNVRRRESQDAKFDRFYSSVKSRLLVAEVIARIQAGSEFSSDFLVLLVLAGMIAFMGLLENSSVVLVASMLVSPLMGPILAGIFGGVIQDQKLTRKGIIHETEALLICIGIGFLFGLLIAPFAEAYGCPQWPTPEMMSRGELRSLWVGVLIAVPSGAGVALSVLGGNAGSLVGVAISASLLPPAVNAGIFWALAIVLATTDGSHSGFHGFGTAVDPLTNLTVSLYQPRHSDDPAMESFLLGLTSLALTLLNILCIILTGVLILRLKEVTPEKIPQKFSNFWRKDIKAHRNYYKTLTAEDNQKLLNEMESLGIRKKSSEGLEGTFLQSMFDRAAHDSDLMNIREWVALPPSTLPPSSTNKPRLDLPDDQEALLSPSSNTTLSLDFSSLYPPGRSGGGGGGRGAPLGRSGGHTAPVKGDSVDPFQNYPTVHSAYNGHNNSYATVHGAYNNNNNNSFNSFLNVPNFFQSEFRRSAVFRRRLYSAGDQHVNPTKL